MSRMFQSLDFLLLSCVFLTVESRQGQILPPQNVSLRWISAFGLQLSWKPPQHSVENCKYTVEWNENEYDVEVLTKVLYIVMKGGSLQVAVKTVCNDRSSELIKVIKTYPELTSELQCYVHAANQTRCSWVPNPHAADLRFFYRLLVQDGSVSINDKPDLTVRECSSYKYTGGVTSCDLGADTKHDIHILFNGTLNNTLARNSFKRRLLENVRPPSLKWTVNKTGRKFSIDWTPPDIQIDWKITIRYTNVECNETKNKSYGRLEAPVELDLDSYSSYRMAIKAEPTRGEGGTPWSEEKYFEADTNPWLYSTIIIPLMFAGLAALIFVCCKKNKESLFPKVPEPRDFLSDISDNNNKSTVRNLYVPPEEEETCKITLVADPHSNLLDV